MSVHYDVMKYKPGTIADKTSMSMSIARIVDAVHSCVTPNCEASITIMF